MQKDEFFQILRDELIRCGVAHEIAQRHVKTISQTFSEEDIAKIEQIHDPAEIAELAQGIVMVKQHTSCIPKQEPACTSDAEDIQEIPPDDSDPDDEDMKVYSGSGKSVFAEASPDIVPTQEDIVNEDFSEIIHDDCISTDPSPTSHGVRTFWILFICTLPLTASLLAAYFSVFAVLFTALCALIVLLVAGLIGGVAVGSTIALTGIIYGIMQLVTAVSAAPGLYEIGLGTIIAGISMAGGILIYNIAIRLIPLLIRWLGTLFRFCTGKLKDLFHMAKEACYKL